MTHDLNSHCFNLILGGMVIALASRKLSTEDRCLSFYRLFKLALKPAALKNSQNDINNAGCRPEQAYRVDSIHTSPRAACQIIHKTLIVIAFHIYAIILRSLALFWLFQWLRWPRND